MMVSMSKSRRYWAKPIDITSFTDSHDYDMMIQGRLAGPVVCFICKVYLPQAPNVMKEKIMSKHKTSVRHSRSLRLVKLNSICVDDSLNDVKLLCRICDRHLDLKENVVEHIRDQHHRTWLKHINEACFSATLLVTANVVSIDNFLSCKSDLAFCNVCNVDVECSTQEIIAHTAEESHRKLFLEALLPYSGIFPIENNTVMWCKVCDLRLSNHFEEVLVHLTGDQSHGQWFHDIHVARQQDISSMDFLTDLNEMKVTCTRCDLKLRIDFCSITAHIHSETHRLRHRGIAFKSVKSLDEYGFWPIWFHWNFFMNIPREVREYDDEIDQDEDDEDDFHFMH